MTPEEQDVQMKKEAHYSTTICYKIAKRLFPSFHFNFELYDRGMVIVSSKFYSPAALRKEDIGSDKAMVDAVRKIAVEFKTYAEKLDRLCDDTCK